MYDKELALSFICHLVMKGKNPTVMKSRKYERDESKEI